jgi:hypothetical protein
MTPLRSLFLFLLPVFASAQSYDIGLGMRLGTEWGVTGQLRLPFVHKNFVLEGIALSAFQTEEGSITLLGKQHQPILSRRLNLFYGGGVHAGWSNEIDGETGQTFNGPVGVTGIVGLEITLNRINLSYDYKPAVNLSGGASVVDLQTAVSVRYVLANRNAVWDKGKEKDRRKRRRARERERKREERARRDKRWYEIWKRGG